MSEPNDTYKAIAEELRSALEKERESLSNLRKAHRELIIQCDDLKMLVRSQGYFKTDKGQWARTLMHMDNEGS